MAHTTRSLGAACIAMFALAGCVSQSKYDGVRKRLTDAEAESAQRQHDLDSCRTGKSAAETRAGALDESMKASAAELDELRKQRAEADKRLAAFTALTEKFRKMIDAGNVQVVVRDGRMVMKLPAGILFDSGSAELSKPGQMALMEVAVILKGFTDRHFMIAGHTDNVPPAKGAKYSSNWALSTLRAVTVTEFLIGAGMKPESLVAAGYGEFDPVSKSNKSENRRIEIVLLPNIEELPQMPDPGTTKPATPDK